MKKMIYLAAFAIMMAMGNMNAFANKNGAKHNEVHMNSNGRMEVRYDGHNDVYAHRGHKMSKHERKMLEERRRMEELRRREEARRREEERRRMEAERHHAAHHHAAVVDNVAAGVVVGVSVAALIGALAQ